MKTNDKLRMIQWLLLALVLYGLALVATQPQLQTALWKGANTTSGSFLGYWIDRHLFGRVTTLSTPARIIARALIIVASVIGMTNGL